MGKEKEYVEHMLSTIDNPYNPFANYTEWMHWDIAAGYNTAGMLDRIVVTSDELSEADQSLAIELAIEEIVEENVLGVFIKVTRDYVPLLPRTSAPA